MHFIKSKMPLIVIQFFNVLPRKKLLPIKLWFDYGSISISDFFVGKKGISLNLGNTAYTTYFGESQNTVVWQVLRDTEVKISAEIPFFNSLKIS